MNVFFATAPFDRPKDSKASHYFEPLPGIFLLSEILRTEDCEVDVELDLDLQVTEFPNSLLKRALSADFICLSASSFNWGALKAFLHLLAKHSPPPVVVGGIHPTLIPEYLVLTSPVPIIAVIGEGEQAIIELLQYFRGQRKQTDIKGICYQENEQVIFTPQRPLLTTEELGKTPLIHWDDTQDNLKYLSVQTTRGCLMSCAFCSIPFRRSWRPFSLSHILRSIEVGMHKLPEAGRKYVVFADDCFTPKQSFAIDVLDEVQKRFPQVRLNIEARVRDLLKPGFLEKLAQSPVEMMQVGVECGYDAGLRKIRKGLKITEVEELGQRSYELGIGHRIRYSYIIGFPWETMRELKTTIDFAYKIARRYGGVVQINWWMTVPGNPLFIDTAQKYGFDEAIFDNIGWSHDKDIFFKTHPWLSMDTVQFMQQYANLLMLLNTDIPAIGSVFSGPWVSTEKQTMELLENLLLNPSSS